MSRLVRYTLALHRLLQGLRNAEVRDRFDAEEHLVLTEDLHRCRQRGPWYVIRQWPALVRDGLADIVTTRQASPRDTLGRRSVDLLAVVLLAPPALVLTGVLAVVVRAITGAPAFVTLTYRGLNGKPIRFHKLRTMTTDPTPRVNGVGSILRRTCLDELPAIVSLARGEVTLVGQRAQPAASEGTAMTSRPGLITWSQAKDMPPTLG